MRITVRGAALLSCLAVMASALGAYASPNRPQRPQITDAQGDYPVASADIISGRLSTVPGGTNGLLQIELKLAAAPTASMPYSYTVGFEVPGCRFVAVYFGGAVQHSAVGCATGNTALPEGPYSIRGSTITFTVPMSGALKRGTKAKSLFAGTEPSGATSHSIFAALGDTATGTDWYLGSDRPSKK